MTNSSSNAASLAPSDAPRSGPASYSIEWYTTTGAFPAELWATCFAPPLEGLWWYQAMERAGLEDQFIFSFAGINRDGVLVGIAPVFQMDLGLEIVLPDEIKAFSLWLGRVVPSLRYQRTLFIGSPCSEEGTIGLIPGVLLADVLPALVAAVEARAAEVKAHMIVWKDVPEPVLPVMETHRALKSYFKVASFPGTSMADFPATWEGYLARLSGQGRHSLKKKLRLSRAAIDLQANVIQNPDPAAMAEIWRLFMFTYERATTRFERLTPKFFDELAKAPSTHFIMLRRKADGQLVAFMLCYADKSCTTNKFIGIDYGLGNELYLYFRLFEEFALWASSLGARSVRSGQTGYRAKFDLGHKPDPLNNFAKNRNWLMNKISALVVRSITWSTLDPDLKNYVEAEKRKAAKRKDS